MTRHMPLLTGRVLGYRAVQVLEYVQAEISATGQAPSYDMIADRLGMTSRSRVHDVVVGLERRGFLSRAGSGKVRRIRLGVG